MAGADATLPITPAEQYLRALWRGRWLFLAIVAVFLGGSFIVTALLPKTYSSTAMLGARLLPQLEPAAPLFGSAILNNQTPTTELYELGPRRFVRRLQANSVVTAAARELGLLGPDEVLDERVLHRW